MKIAPFLFGLAAILAFGVAILHDDSAHMARNPHHISE